MKKILILLVTVLCTMSAQAVDDISLSVVKSGISPNWAASVNDDNVVTLNRGGAAEWDLFPTISTANYTGVEVVFTAAPTITEGQTLSLSVWYDGEENAVSTTYESGTTLSATFAENKKVNKVALTTGWTDNTDGVYATFTLTSVTVKGGSGTATKPSANVDLPFSKLAGGWGSKDNDNKTVTQPQFSSIAWTFTTPVSTDDFGGSVINLTSSPTENGKIVIKYGNGQEQELIVDESTTKVTAVFNQTGTTVSAIQFNGPGYLGENVSADAITYGIGDAYLALSYNISISSSTNGTITADKAKAMKGETVTLTITPDSGYELDEINISYVQTGDPANSDGASLTRTDTPEVGNSGTVAFNTDDNTFVMPEGNVTITATFKQSSSDATTKTLTAGKEWLTFCSPYTFAVPAGLKAYTVTAVSRPVGSETGTITLTEESYIVANVPMLLKNTNLSTTTFTVTIDETSRSTTGTPVSEYKGVTSTTAIAAGTYVLIDGTFLLTDGGNLPAYNCYLQFMTPAATRSFNFGGDGDGTTGIHNIGTAKLNDGQWYDLMGRKVDQPRKGIYIRNGKKVMVK